MRRLLLICSLALLGTVGSTSASAQETSARFEIVAVGDTTFTFRPGSGWVKRGLRGIAVDPRRRDVMVARFHVASVQDGVATAVITGQTTNITTDYVALMIPPERPWYTRTTFWIGAVVGAIVGAVAGASI